MKFDLDALTRTMVELEAQHSDDVVAFEFNPGDYRAWRQRIKEAVPLHDDPIYMSRSDSFGGIDIRQNAETRSGMMSIVYGDGRKRWKVLK